MKRGMNFVEEHIVPAVKAGTNPTGPNLPTKRGITAAMYSSTTFGS